MFNKLKCLFSFNWFYIILFIILSLYTFWDEITIGRETIKFIKNNKSVSSTYECYSSRDSKINFIDLDNISDTSVSVYDGEIKYLYFRPITNERLNNLNIKGNKKLYNSFITMDEFKDVLEVLHRNDYIMVDIFDIYKQIYRDGSFKVQRQDLKIPKGKTPFVLFVDDFGCDNSKLIIDDDLCIKSKRYNDKEDRVSYEDNVITIVNKFISDHEDFSFNNSKGVVSLIDSDAIFGYNTGKNVKRSRKNNDKIKKLSNDIYEAKKIADKLKEDRWRFACNTYGNINFRNVTSDLVKSDMENWSRYVSNIIGHTNLFVYPEGNTIDKSDERFKYLNKNGFNIFCSSMKTSNKDSFKIEPYIDISRDLICYDTISSSNKDYYNIFKDVIINPKKIKNKL